MNQSAKCHISEATKHIRSAIKYSAETDDTALICKLTEVLQLFDSWVETKTKEISETGILNNTKFRWKNEYSFVPALQTSDDVL